jgi:hypothetical protein
MTTLPTAAPHTRPDRRSRKTRPPAALAIVAAVGLAVGGYVHFCLYRHGYRSIPTIGRMFAANVAVSAIIAVVLLLRRDLGLRLAGMAVAAGTLAAFGLSRTPGGLFKFQERGLDPSPQALVALVAEVVAFGALAASLLWDLSPRMATLSRLPIGRRPAGQGRS